MTARGGLLPWIIVALAATQPACEERRRQAEQAKAEAARKAEEARLEAERAQKLPEALKVFAERPGGDDAGTEFASARKQLPARFRDDSAQIESCYLKQLDAAYRATLEKRYAEVGPPAAQCLNAMEAYHHRQRRALLAMLLDDKAKPPSEREQKIESALSDLASAALKTAAAMLEVMLAYGPPDTRMATFEAIASRLPGEEEQGRWSRTLLQRAFAGESAGAQKERMAGRLKALGVPLAEPSPSPSAPAASAP